VAGLLLLAGLAVADIPGPPLLLGGEGSGLAGSVATVCRSGCDYSTIEEVNNSVNGVGTDLCIMDDEDYSADTIVLDWGAVSTDHAVVGTCYIDAGDSNALHWYADGTGIGRGERAKLSFVDYRGATDRDWIEVNDVTMSRKWNPGHYTNDPHGRHGNVGLDDASQRKRHSWWASLEHETAIQGHTLVLRWGLLEPERNNYENLDEIIEDLDFLEQRATQKQLILWLKPQSFGRGNERVCPSDDNWENETKCVNCNVYPGWLWDAYPGKSICDRTNHHQSLLRTWDPDIRAEYAGLLAEMGRRLDSHPNLEAVIINLESATGRNNEPGFSQDLHRESLKELAMAAKSAFPRTSVVLNINYKIGKPSDYDLTVAWAQEEGIGLGNTDLAPRCVGQPWSKQLPVQDPDCPNGFSDHTTDQQPIRIYNSLGTDDSTGLIPVIYRVAGDQLGGGHWVGQAGGYNPETLVEFCKDVLKCTHMYWTFMGTEDVKVGDPTKQSWREGVLPYIRNNPDPFNSLGCPASSCQ